jgi:hypothetical protein
MGQFETKLEDELVFESYRRFLPHLSPEDLRRDLEKLAYLVLVAHPAAIRWFTAELMGQSKSQASPLVEQCLAQIPDGGE